MVFPTFFNFSLNLAIRSSWSEPPSAPGLVFADCIELLHLWLQRIESIWFQFDHLVMSLCRAFSCVVGRGCLLWPVCSLGKTLLAFALLHSILQGQICLLLQVFLDFLHLHIIFFRLNLLHYESYIIFKENCPVFWNKMHKYAVCELFFL